jgi:hypothetical protein
VRVGAFANIKVVFLGFEGFGGFLFSFLLGFSLLVFLGGLWSFICFGFLSVFCVFFFF